MRIKDQFRVSIIAFSIVLTIIAASVIITEQQTAQLNSQATIALDIQTGANNLSYLSNNYLLYQDNSSLIAWQQQFSSLSNILSKLYPSNSEQLTLLNKLKGDAQRLNSVFNDVVSFLQSAPRNVSVRVLPEFQTGWSQMAVQYQALAFDAQQLSHSLSNQVDQLNLANVSLIFAFLGLFGAYFITNYLITYRNTLKSISGLQTGIAVIGSGNLDYSLKTNKNDEIGEISQSFNHMTSNLKTMTASKAELEKEISERKNAEENARFRAEELERIQVKLEEKTAEVEEYASQMEKLANQRAQQLKGAERLATIGQTAGMVGHDLRNPLQTITGEIYLSKSEVDALPESQQKQALKESIGNIEAQIDYMNKIVSDLQDFVKPVNPEKVPVDLEKLVITTLSKVKAHDDIAIQTSFEKLPMVSADAQLLKRFL